MLLAPLFFEYCISEIFLSFSCLCGFTAHGDTKRSEISTKTQEGPRAWKRSFGEAPFRLLFGARDPFKSQNLQKVCFRSSPWNFLKYRFSTGGYAPNAALGLPLERQGASKIAPGGPRDPELCSRAGETLTFHENERLAYMRAPSGTSENLKIDHGLAPGPPFGKTRFSKKRKH